MIKKLVLGGELPQSATLTAPSKKEPDIALSDRFIIALSVSLCLTALLAADGNPLSASLTSPFQGSTQWESREDVTCAHSVCVV